MTRRVNAILSRGADWLASDAADRASTVLIALCALGMWSLCMVAVGRAIEHNACPCVSAMPGLIDQAGQPIGRRPG
jgi:hypothetical protein